MSTIGVAASKYGRFLKEFLEPKLDEVVDAGLVEPVLAEHLYAAQALASQAGKVGQVGTLYLGYVLAYIAMDLALTDEQLELLPNMGPAKVQKVRDAKPSLETIQKRHQKREEARAAQAELDLAQAKAEAEALENEQAREEALAKRQALLDRLQELDAQIVEEFQADPNDGPMIEV